MFQLRKMRGRRAEIRKNRPDAAQLWQALKAPDVRISLVIALAFWIGAMLIAGLRDQMVRYRPDQWVHQDVTSRVEFIWTDADELLKLQQQARDAAPRVYSADKAAFESLNAWLHGLPQAVAQRTEEIPKQWQLDSGTITELKKTRLNNPDEYKAWVDNFISLLRDARDYGKLVILPPDEREKDLQVSERKQVRIQAAGSDTTLNAVSMGQTFGKKEAVPLADEQRTELRELINPIAQQSFPASLWANIAAYTADALGPTHQLDPQLTAAAQNEAASRASISQARRPIHEKAVLVPKETAVTPAAWKLLAAEHRAYQDQLGWTARVVSQAGMAGILLIVTAGLGMYIAYYQPRVVRNHARAVAIAALLLSMLLVAQLAALGTGPILVFGIAPTILTAMILTIAYEQRFAMGIASLHGVMTTLALDQSMAFFLVMWAGVLICCFLLDEVRTRSKLVEVGGATALAMMAASMAAGAAAMDPLAVIWHNAMYAGAAGLGVGFVVLGILPFIEKTFRITTSMTLLELADASHPLLRRLSAEAPGTYNHSLHVATLAEAAAESIGANSLLCRVGSYYHDIGKMNKAEYFCENQFDGQNRHLNLTPNVSLLIIIGHVKDGVEMAKEYKLPTVLIPIIQQHHGTTVVEFFYHRALVQRDAKEPDGPEISDVQYRYPGPKPRSREAAVVMISDAVESATRAMTEPTPGKLESLVHDLIMKRLLDGQFDDCDMSFGELEQVERTLVKILPGVYHGRLAYPSAATSASPERGGTPPPALRSA